MASQPEYVYIHKAGYRGRLGGAAVGINRYGLRGSEFDLEKAEGAVRLLIIGDSVVFGWGVDDFTREFFRALSPLVDSKTLQ